MSFLEALLVTAKTNGKNFAVTEPAFLSLLVPFTAFRIASTSRKKEEFSKTNSTTS
jgi:hypothetical protein